VTDERRYRTGHLEVASYIHATQSLKLAGTEMVGNKFEFIFDAPESRGRAYEAEYYRGAIVNALSLFSSHKQLRRMILNQRDYNEQFPGASFNDHRHTNAAAR
jgi:hypothetical protein